MFDEDLPRQYQLVANKLRTGIVPRLFLGSGSFADCERRDWFTCACCGETAQQASLAAYGDHALFSCVGNEATRSRFRKETGISLADENRRTVFSGKNNRSLVNFVKSTFFKSDEWGSSVVCSVGDPQDGNEEAIATRGEDGVEASAFWAGCR